MNERAQGRPGACEERETKTKTTTAKRRYLKMSQRNLTLCMLILEIKIKKRKLYMNGESLRKTGLVSGKRTDSYVNRV